MADRRLILGISSPQETTTTSSLPSAFSTTRERKGARMTDTRPDVTSRRMSVRAEMCQNSLAGDQTTSQDLLLGLREALQNELAGGSAAATTTSDDDDIPTIRTKKQRARSIGSKTDRHSASSTTEADVKMQTLVEESSEVDSRDTPATIEPLHIVGTLDDLPPARATSSKLRPAPVTPRKPRLTLSAFRRPEETVRLTDCDSSRLLENEYNLRAPGCRVIGHGAFSTVRLAIRLGDGGKVAVKSISKYDALRSRRLRRGGPRHLDEWEIMKKLQNNPYVLSLLDVFETDEEIHLVTEYCEGGELFDAIKRKGSKRNSFRMSRYSEAQAARITSQILHALKGLHSHNIVHRDIKAENILLLNKDESDLQVKLADFGVARLRTSATSESGSDGEASPSTPGLVNSTNAPPETCKEACGPAADVYSLGVTLYILLCGFPPVFCEGIVEFPDAYWTDISDQAKAIVRGMLQPNPCHRTTVEAAMSDPWVRQQTTRVRRGSISANLELVKARLFQSLDDASSGGNSSNKRLRRSSLVLSPMKRRRSMDNSPKKRGVSADLTISMTDLYAVGEKKKVSGTTCPLQKVSC